MTITLGRFAKFPRASPLGIPQTCLGLRVHSITNVPQAMQLLIIIDTQYDIITWEEQKSVHEPPREVGYIFVHPTL